MVGLEDLILTFRAVDETTPVVNSIASNAQSAMSNLSNTMSSSAGSMASNYQSTFDSIAQGFAQLNSGMYSLNTANHQLMTSLGSTKSAMDWVYGTTSKEDTNKVLVKRFAETKEEQEDLYSTIDKVTDSSLTSMQDLIPAMNAFKSATSATAQQLKDDVTADMANFGAFVLAQTGSTQLALTAMMDLSKGIKGRYASLDQYGISAEALKATGKWREAEGGSKTKNWTGDEKDIKGYMDAVTEVVGDTTELMNTNEGLNAQMGKMWSRAGKRIGHEMMPGMKSLKQAFLDLDNELDGNLSTNVLRVSLYMEEASQKAYQFNTLLDTIRKLSDVWKFVATRIGGSLGVTNANTLATQENALATQESTLALQENSLARSENALAMQEQMAMGGMPMGQSPTGTSSSSGATGMVEYTAMDLTGDAISNKLFNNSPYGRDAIGRVATQRVNDAKKAEKILEETQEVEEKVANRISLVDKWKDIKSQPKHDGLSKFLETTGEDTNIASLLRKNKEERNVLKTTIDSVDDEGVISQLKEKLSSNRQKSLKLANAQQYSNDLEKTLSGMVGRGVDGNLLKQSTDKFRENIINEVNPPTTLTGLIRDKFSKFGTSLQDGLERGFGGIGDAIGKASTKLKGINFKTISTKLSDLKFDSIHDLGQKLDNVKLPDIRGKITRAFSNLNQGLGEGFSNLSLNGITTSLRNFVGGLPVIGGLLGTASAEMGVVDGELAVVEAETAMAGAEAGVVGATSTVASAEMTGATTGISMMGLAEMGLAGALSTLLVPTLAIAGVIAILIPIVAGLVLEALFFLTLIMQVVNAMNFGGIDLTNQIEALKQLGSALLNIGLAMGALVLVDIATYIAQAITVFTGITGPLETAVATLTEVGTILQEFSNVEIDENTISNIESIANGLNAISSAMMSLTGTTIATGFSGLVAWIFQFKSTTDALEEAKKDIIDASKVLEEFGEISPIDETTSNNIQSVCDALASVGDAMGGLRSIRDSQNLDVTGWIGDLFGGVDISSAILNAKDEIISASKVLNQFGDVQAVDEGIGDKLKSVGDALKGIGDSISALRKIRDDNNWDNSGVVGFIFGDRDVIGALRSAKGDIVRASQAINDLKNEKALTEIDGSVATSLKRLSTTLSRINTALGALKKINITSEGMDLSKIPSMLENVKTTIIDVSKKLKDLGGNKGIVNVTGVSEKVKVVSDTLGQVSKVSQTLSELPKLNTETIGKNVTDAVESIKNASTTLKTLTDNGAVADMTGVVDKIKPVAQASSILGGTITKITSIPKVNAELVGANVDQAVQTVTKVSTSISGLKGLNTDFGSTTDHLKKITDVVTPLSTLTNNLKTFPFVNTEVVDSRINRAVTTANRVGQALGKLNVNVDAGLSGKLTPVNQVANKLKTVAEGLKTFPFINTEVVDSRINRAVTAVNHVSTSLGKLNINSGGNTGALGQLQTQLTELRNALNSAQGFWTGGKNVGTSIKNGVKAGLSGLGSVLNQALTSAEQASGAWATGNQMGIRATNGFRSGFQVASIVTSEIQRGLNAVTFDMGGLISSITGGVSSASSGTVGTGVATTDEGPGGLIRAINRTVNPRNYTQIGRAISSNMNSNRINTLRNMNSQSTYGQGQRPIHISIGEGAVQLDARNLSTKESRQIMINALEGLNDIRRIDTV